MAWYRSVGPLAVAVLALQALCAAAQDINCSSATNGDEDDDDDEIRGNLNIAVPCVLRGTEVRGNVILFAGGSLTAREVHIHGELEGSRADFVDIAESRIDGRVRLQELVGDLSTLERTDFRRDVELTGNRSRLELLNNELRGDLHVLGNTGGVLISGNAIDDDLRCTGNSPAPTGTANDVDDDVSE